MPQVTDPTAGLKNVSGIPLIHFCFIFAAFYIDPGNEIECVNDNGEEYMKDYSHIT